jgi:hypothetical protein
MKAAHLAAMLLVLACASTLGQLKPSPSSREELRRCLAEGDGLEEERAIIEGAVRRVEAAQRDLQTLSGIYLANRKHVTRDAAAVEAYNQKVARLKALSSQLNDMSGSVLARQEDFNARIELSNQRCAVMVVKQDDQEAVLIERIQKAAQR